MQVQEHHQKSTTAQLGSNLALVLVCTPTLRSALTTRAHANEQREAIQAQPAAAAAAAATAVRYNRAPLSNKQTTNTQLSSFHLSSLMYILTQPRVPE